MPRKPLDAGAGGRFATRCATACNMLQGRLATRGGYYVPHPPMLRPALPEGSDRGGGSNLWDRRATSTRAPWVPVPLPYALVES
jgi:hypothetical protein